MGKVDFAMSEIKSVITCARCGKETPKKSSSQKYCPTCSIIVRAEQKKARHKTYVHRCCKCGKAFTSKGDDVTRCPDCYRRASQRVKLNTVEKNRRSRMSLDPPDERQLRTLYYLFYGRYENLSGGKEH